MRIGTRTRQVAWIVAGVAALALLFAGSRDYFRQAERIESLRVGAFSGDVGALAWIAEEQGFFARVGLKVEMRGYESGKESVDALRAGQVDLATASEFVVADRSFAEPDLRVLSSVCQYWNKGLVGRRDRGIATAADLKGKRVGVTTTSTAEQTLVVFLAMQGLTLNDVEAVNLPPKQLIEQIVDAKIDAAITWQPHVSAIERRLGGNAVSLLDRGSDAYLLVLTRQGLLPDKHEAFTRFLRALILAEEWIKANPVRAKQWLSARFSLDAEYIERLWPTMRLEVGLPQEILEIMDGEARWLLARRREGVLPDFGQTMSPAALAAVKPAAVTVFSRTR